MKVHIDFETRAVRDIKSGLANYISCPCFGIMWLSYAIDDQKVVSIKGPVFNKHFHNDIAELFKLAADENVIFVAHNAVFEYLIWVNYMAERYGLPVIALERWRCTLASARSKNLPGALGLLADTLQLGHRKDETGKRVMMKMCKPMSSCAKSFDVWREEPADIIVLGEYCDDDVETERAVDEEIGLLSDEEQKVWVETTRQGLLGVRYDTVTARAALTTHAKLKERWLAEGKELCGFNVTQVAKLKNWLIARGVQLPITKDAVTGEEKVELRAEHVRKLTATLGDKHELAKKVLEARAKVSSTSVRKYETMLKLGHSGYLHLQFNYHGASTGRWSSVGVQLQNFPRGEYPEGKNPDDYMLDCIRNIRAGDAERTSLAQLKTALRGCIIPPAGELIYQMDYSQIEARVLAWLAGEQWVLDAFVEGKDMYKVTAALMFNLKIEDVTKEQRFLGKVGDLSLQFMGGEGAFAGMAENYGTYIEKKQALKIKKQWRAAHPKTCEFWDDLEKAAILAVKTGQTTTVGRLKFKVVGDFLYVKLPSGRKIAYYKPKVQVVTVRIPGYDKFDKEAVTFIGLNTTRKIFWKRMSIHGGIFAENVTQATAACIMRVPFVSMRDRTNSVLDPRMTVHDEFVCYGPESDTEYWLNEMKSIMLDAPAWADGLPIDAAGFTAKRFRK